MADNTQITPLEQFLIWGEDTQIRCNSFFVDPIWTHNGVPFPSSIKHSTKKRFIRVHNFKKGYKGEVQCKGRDKKDHEFFAVSVLNFVGMPRYKLTVRSLCISLMWCFPSFGDYYSSPHILKVRY